MLSEKSKHFSIFVIGETGNGKSQFCQYLTNDSSTFHPSESANSYTQQVFSKSVIVNGHSITVFDTPGLNDKESNADSKHIQEMVTSLRGVKDCKAFLIVLNPHQPRFSKSTQLTVEYFRSIFGSNIIGNLGLIWTKTTKAIAKKWNEKKGDQISKEEEYVSKVIQVFGQSVSGHIPSFYVNSCPDDDIYYPYDKELHEGEIKKLLTWASSNEVYDCGQAKIIATKEDELEKEKQKAKDAEEAKEKAEKEAKETKEKAEKEAKEAKEKAEKEAKEAKEKAEREAKEAKEKAEREVKEAKEKAEQAIKEAREKADRETNRIDYMGMIDLIGKLGIGPVGYGVSRSEKYNSDDDIEVNYKPSRPTSSRSPPTSRPEPRRQMCIGTKRDGASCHAWAVSGSMYCRHHG